MNAANGAAFFYAWVIGAILLGVYHLNLKNH